MNSGPKTKLAQQFLSRLCELLLFGDSPEKVSLAIKTLAGNNGLRKNVAYLIRDHCADHPRPEIYRFAGLMELKLRKHDPVRGDSWKRGDPKHHLDCIRQIYDELVEAVQTNNSIGLKAADLANHAMMLSDLSGDLSDV